MEQGTKPPSEKKPDNWAAALGLASSVGLVMVFSVLIGLGTGLWLDSRWQTKPVMMIIGILTGMISGFYSIWLIIKDIAKQ